MEQPNDDGRKGVLEALGVLLPRTNHANPGLFSKIQHRLTLALLPSIKLAVEAGLVEPVRCLTFYLRSSRATRLTLDLRLRRREVLPRSIGILDLPVFANLSAESPGQNPICAFTKLSGWLCFRPASLSILILVIVFEIGSIVPSCSHACRAKGWTLSLVMACMSPFMFDISPSAVWSTDHWSCELTLRDIRAK